MIKTSDKNSINLQTKLWAENLLTLQAKNQNLIRQKFDQNFQQNFGQKFDQNFKKTLSKQFDENFGPKS